MQLATRTETRPWGHEDKQEAIDAVDAAWGVIRPHALVPLRGRVAALMRELRDSAVPRSAVHGDFWHGNLAIADGQLRVYDWEWAALEGTPFIDLWTYELGVLLRPPPAAPPDDDLVAASKRVMAELRRRRIDPRFALATLAPSLGRLAIRMRVATGQPGPAERCAG